MPCSGGRTALRRTALHARAWHARCIPSRTTRTNELVELEEVLMRCRDVMHKVEWCSVNDPVATIAATMRSRHVGFLPVCNDLQQVIGTITDRDLAVRVLPDRLSPDTPVHAVMSKGPITCRPEDLLEDAEQLMERYYKWRIICVDQWRRPVGVISLSDIADAEEETRVARLLREISSRDARVF